MKAGRSPCERCGRVRQYPRARVRRRLCAPCQRMCCDRCLRVQHEVAGMSQCMDCWSPAARLRRLQERIEARRAA
jgi:hypothetical protein